VNETEAAQYGIPRELDIVARRLARKLTSVGVNREEYILMKTMILLNPGISSDLNNLTESAHL
jgi:hypothetical protein